MLAKTPPMGWNSWNTFGHDINEALVFEMADAMADLGYRDAGYEYLVIDDCWAEMERDSEGRLVADHIKFPHGMKYVADYIHSRGLKFGMYSCAGSRTCAGYPASYDYEYIDAAAFAEWGVDFLKYDFCNFPLPADAKNRYLRMGMALRHSGRDILFSGCTWGWEDPWKWMNSAGAHMYRSTPDIADNFKSVTDIAMSQFDNFCMSGSGCFNDMDMLTVGMYGKGHKGLGGCDDVEYRTQFGLWCFFGTPLMMGCDIRNTTEEARKLLQNRDLIALNQDEECRAPYLASDQGRYGHKYFFVRHLSDGDIALGYFNFDDNDSTFSLSYTFDEIGIPRSSGFGLELTDLFTGENIGVKRDYFVPTVEPHGCRIYRAKLVKL